MTPLSLKAYQGYGAMRKENKRCIPKEGMPHASAYQEKKKREKGKMHTKRRYATCLGMSKKREEKIAPYPKRKKKERWCI